MIVLTADVEMCILQKLKIKLNHQHKACSR